MYSTYESGDSGSIAPSPGQNVHNSTVCVCVGVWIHLNPRQECVFLQHCEGMCVCVTSGLRVALVQAGQMGPWREKAMGKRLVLF